MVYQPIVILRQPIVILRQPIILLQGAQGARSPTITAGFSRIHAYATAGFSLVCVYATAGFSSVCTDINIALNMPKPLQRGFWVYASVSILVCI